MTWGMRLAALAATTGTCVLTQAALAAPPQVAGKYATQSYRICQTVIHAPTQNFKTSANGTAAAVTNVDLDWNAGSHGNFAGIISVTVGTVTFPASASSSGTASMTDVEVLGHSMRNDNPANNIGFKRNPPSTQTGVSFSLTASTFTAGDNVFDASYGNIVGGVARTIYMVRKPTANEYCLDAMSLTKQ